MDLSILSCEISKLHVHVLAYKHGVAFNSLLRDQSEALAPIQGWIQSFQFSLARSAAGDILRDSERYPRSFNSLLRDQLNLKDRGAAPNTVLSILSCEIRKILSDMNMNMMAVLSILSCEIRN